MPRNAKLELHPLKDIELKVVSGGSPERPMQHRYSVLEFGQEAFNHGVRRLE